MKYGLLVLVSMVCRAWAYIASLFGLDDISIGGYSEDGFKCDDILVEHKWGWTYVYVLVNPGHYRRIMARPILY
jgi:hypothetical protein